MGSFSMAIPPQGHTAHQVNSRIAAASGTLQARLHNFVKHALLQQLVPPGSTVCDLYCGHGVDTEKWVHAQIGRYVGMDSAASILEEAQVQWNNLQRPYCADFCEVDPSSANLETELRYMGLPMDVVTCMGHLQDCFLKEEMVRSLLQNVASILKPGGYFFGITADSSTLWSKFQKAVEQAHRAGVLRVLPRVHSEHYVISFEDDRFTPFGTKYTLQFTDGVVFESQQLIHFPSLIRLAEEVGLEYIELQNLQEFYDDYRLQFPDILRTTCANLVDPKGRLPQFAHDILSLYTTFIFKKADYLDPNYMLSPFPPPDEEQSEICSEDACNDNKDRLSPPEDVNISLKKFPVVFPHQTENKESPVPRRAEDQRACMTIMQVEGNLHQSPLGDTCKENAQDLSISSDSKQSDIEGKEEVKLDIKAAAENAMTAGEREDIKAPKRSLELEVAIMTQLPGFPCKGDDEDRQGPDKECKDLESAEEQIQSELPPESSGHPVINPRSPLGDNKQQQDVADGASVLQLHIANRDTLMREASILEDVVMEEVREEHQEQSCSEDQAIEEKLSKSMSKKRTLGTRDETPTEDLPTLVVRDMSLTELDAREQKVNDGQSDEMKEVSNHDSEILVPTDVQKASSPATDFGTNGDRPSANDFDMNGDRSSIKQSLGRLNTALREESVSKRLQSELMSGQQRYRSGRPHHHCQYLSYSEERQEQSHGPRHNVHSSHNPKSSRDRVADHRSEYLSPNQRGDSHRGHSRNFHNSPTFVPFSHFVSQMEFPIFHSPNTPGILGPGPPPVLLIEPMCPLWPIPPPLERRVFPKSWTPRKPGSERESFGGSGRRESPKRHLKDSHLREQKASGCWAREDLSF